MIPTHDRLTGVLIAAACADALGAGYEFGSPLADEVPVQMRGQGAFEPGEWTDDSAQLIAIALAAADGLALDTDAGLDTVAQHFLDWYLSPASAKDIGIHTGQVFREVTARRRPGIAREMRQTAESKEQRHPNSSGGNGALMRTAPVAIALGDDPGRMVKAATSIAAMTHADDRSSQACAVWCLAIRQALLAGDPSDLDGLLARILAAISIHLPEHAPYWMTVLEEAHGVSPRDYYSARPNNGYCVTALQAAWGAVTSTEVPDVRPGRHLRLATEAAVRGGGDTDTVACIAGALLGALWGASAVPSEWRRRVFGWPNMRDRDLVELADAVRNGRSDRWPYTDHADYTDWPRRFEVVSHPHDGGVVLSGAAAAQGEIAIAGAPVTAVVSLCRMGRRDLDHFALAQGNSVQVWLIDEDGANANLELVLRDAAAAVDEFRRAGHRVLLHCVESASRTPTVAAMYAALHRGIAPEAAIADVLNVLPHAHPRPEFLSAVRRAWDN